jgi:hypothetical protein
MMPGDTKALLRKIHGMKMVFGFAMLFAALAVNTAAEPLALDDFNYTDGPLVEVSSGLWRHHSGNTTGEVSVINGAVQLTQAATEDVNLPWTPLASTSNSIWCARFTVQFSEPPKGASGGYFAHFKDGVSGFRCRIFGTTNGAAPGCFRLGISNGGSTATNLAASDLALWTTHTILCRYDGASGVSALWIDPGEVPGEPVLADDVVKPLMPVAFALRQSDGIGALSVDDLQLATTLADLGFTDGSPEAAPPVLQFTNVLDHLVRPGDAATNTFDELALQPGERWTWQTRITGTPGYSLNVQPPAQLPNATLLWSMQTSGDSVIDSELVFEPGETEAGQAFEFTISADCGGATNAQTVRVYVPNAEERALVLSEFLANPTSDPTAAHFNPLAREMPSAKPSIEDEFLEWVNNADTPLDLSRWTISDAVRLRHVFPTNFSLAAHSALIVYGGPTNNPPQLDVPAMPASESSSGLALNNSGTETILLRNGRGQLLLRIVYEGSQLSEVGSLSRWPDLNGAFCPQSELSTNAVTPGHQWDGSPFQTSPELPPPQPILNIRLNEWRQCVLEWEAVPAHAYQVWKASTLNGPFETLQAGLEFGDGHGSFIDTDATQETSRYYRVSTP